jgi:hypothetical protein
VLDTQRNQADERILRVILRLAAMTDDGHVLVLGNRRRRCEENGEKATH